MAMTRTPDETKKGLEVCNIWMVDEPNHCMECPYFCTKDCADTLMKHALALIQQLQDDNAEKAERIQQLEATVSEKEKVVAELSGKIGQLESQNRCFKENKESCEKRMIDLAQRMPRWISVEERLPEEFEDVLVHVNIGDASWYEVAHWREGHWSVPCITHWMPIPPYVEKED